MSEAPYQVYLFVGANAPTPPSGVTIVDITPAEVTAEAALASLEASGLTAADLRTRVLLVVDPTYREASVLMYAALCGFAGRRVDFTDLTEVVDARSLHLQATGAPDTGKPEELPELVQVGLGHPDTTIVSFPAVDALTASDVTVLRYARHARLAVADRTAKDALTLLVVASGVRMRGESDRMPVLVHGDEPVVADEVPGVDLEALRRAAGEARRTHRIDDRGATVDARPLTERQERLVAAAAVPVEDVLVRLGSFQNEETGFWRCPRPDRHRNGDANPSTRVSDGRVRCFRCDPEPADSLRLVIDCKRLSPDEAAAWLLGV